MATLQTVKHFRQYENELLSPCLEIGSLVDSSYIQWSPKNIHSKRPEVYTGIDIFSGEGVDHVINLTRDDEVAKLPQEKYKTIHCHYVMEHVTDIFSMARNMERVLDQDGVLLFSVPFAWRLHRIPVDMWRFTPQSIDYLFPNVEFIKDKCALSLRHGEKTYALDKFPEFDFGKGLDGYPGYIKWYVKILRRLGLHNNIFNQRALLFESNLMMYGVKRDKPTYTFIDPAYI